MTRFEHRPSAGFFRVRTPFEMQRRSFLYRFFPFLFQRLFPIQPELLYSRHPLLLWMLTSEKKHPSLGDRRHLERPPHSVSSSPLTSVNLCLSNTRSRPAMLDRTTALACSRPSFSTFHEDPNPGVFSFPSRKSTATRPKIPPLIDTTPFISRWRTRASLLWLFNYLYIGLMLPPCVNSTTILVGRHPHA